MTTIKQAISQALVMLALFAVAVAGINLLTYIVLVVLPDDFVVVAVLFGIAVYAGRACHE